MSALYRRLYFVLFLMAVTAVGVVVAYCYMAAAFWVLPGTIIGMALAVILMFFGLAHDSGVKRVALVTTAFVMAIVTVMGVTLLKPPSELDFTYRRLLQVVAMSKSGFSGPTTFRNCSLYETSLPATVELASQLNGAACVITLKSQAPIIVQARSNAPNVRVERPNTATAVITVGESADVFLFTAP